MLQSSSGRTRSLFKELPPLNERDVTDRNRRFLWKLTSIIVLIFQLFFCSICAAKNSLAPVLPARIFIVGAGK